MLVTLYTFRVTLKVLGFIDYGVYNAIAGVIAIFTFINITLTSVAQRYFSYYLGKDDPQQLQKYFSSLFITFAITSCGVAIIGDPIGVWYIGKYVSMPPDRINAAIAVFHFSVLTIMATIMTIPYNSVLISREKMDLYAYISIVEVILKLLVVFLLMYTDFDSLVTYSVLLFGVAIIKLIFYAVYCYRRFAECRLAWDWNLSLYRELGSYIGWNALGIFANVTRLQSIVLILNSFFGPLINAAYAIATQISTAINQFMNSFLLAVQPQIVKNYAKDEKQEMFKYIFLASKFSFFLLLLVIIPCMCELPVILRLWLTDFPDYTVLFSRILLGIALIESLCIPLVTAIQATGCIKRYNLLLSCIMLASIPLSIMAICLGANQVSILYISLAVTIISQIVRLYYVIKQTGMSFKQYNKEVLAKIIIVTIAASIVPGCISLFMADSLLRLILITAISLLISCIVIFKLGMSRHERLYILSYVNQMIVKIKGY